MTPPPEVVLQTSHLGKTYDQSIHAVKDLSITVKRGEVFGFLGPNGAGKSTSIAMMIGLIRSSSGSVTIDGKESNQQKGIIGYIPQKLIFYEHLTVQENLELFAEMLEISQQAPRITEVMQLLQLEEIRDRRAGKLSGGQARRLNVALALLHTPRILFADEPSAGMDPQSRNILWQSIRTIADQGVTIILTTHLMETAAALSDRIAIMDHGQIVALGTVDELIQSVGLQKSIAIELATTSAEELTPLLEGYQYTCHDNILEIQFKEELRIGELIQQLEQQAQITRLEFREPTLEDVFIHITGSQLREA